MKHKHTRFKFYIDEGFPVPAGNFLKKERHNIEFVVTDIKKRSKSDEWQIKYATKNERIFIALDKDFKHKKSLKSLIKKSYGMILVQSSDPKSEKIIKVMKKVLKRISKIEIKGKTYLASIDKFKEIKIDK